MKFRFLYGRWIPTSGIKAIIDYEVQIPLWSMNTFFDINSLTPAKSSDSSMVDEYGNGDHQKTCIYGSDSSMVDEYYPLPVAI